MLYQDTPLSRALNFLVGTLIVFILITGVTYYLQSSLLIKSLLSGDRKWAYYHWAVILLAMPIIAGIAQRRLYISYPLVTTLLGALASAAVLYPHYKQWWAVPPGMLQIAVYVVVVTGIGFMATQPIKAMFMMAFHIGRSSIPNIAISSGSGSNKKKKPVRKADMSKTQRLRAGGHSDMMAMLELLVGFASLALSIFSIFFLGRG